MLQFLFSKLHQLPHNIVAHKPVQVQQGRVIFEGEKTLYILQCNSIAEWGTGNVWAIGKQILSGSRSLPAYIVI